jgi:hypothetical protein
MSAYQSTGRASRLYFHREYVNQFLTTELAPGDRLANIERDNIRLLHQDVFSEQNCVIAERIAKRFYHSSAFDLGEAPKFFSGEFSDAAAMFLARIYAARHYTAASGIYSAAEDVHNAFVNAWLRCRAFGTSRSDAYRCLAIDDRTNAVHVSYALISSWYFIVVWLHDLESNGIWLAFELDHVYADD